MSFTIMTFLIGGSSYEENVGSSLDTPKNELEESIEASADFLRQKLPYEANIGIICGSGLGFLAENLEETFEFPYTTIPNFPRCTVEGHTGKLVLGKIDNFPILCMQGRLHFYEGYPLWKCTLPVRIMKLLNVKVLIITNSAGAVNKVYKTGDVMIAEDHIDLLRLLGCFSLRGPPGNLLSFNYDPRQRIYDKDLVKIGVQIGKETLTNQSIHRGVYTFSTGPSYETKADLNFLRCLGSDVVGSSSVHEAIVAKSCGMKVFSFSLVTAECGDDYEVEKEEEEIDHLEVLGVGGENRDVIKEFLRKFLHRVKELKLAF